MVLALKTNPGLLILITNESLSFLLSCHGSETEYQQLHDDFLLVREVSCSQLWSWFLPSCLEKRLQFLLSSLFPSIRLNTRCAHDNPIRDDSGLRNCLDERIPHTHRLVDRRLKCKNFWSLYGAGSHESDLTSVIKGEVYCVWPVSILSHRSLPSGVRMVCYLDANCFNASWFQPSGTTLGWLSRRHSTALVLGCRPYISSGLWRSLPLAIRTHVPFPQGSIAINLPTAPL